jgi:TRAP transporter TAXI family solute receptor
LVAYTAAAQAVEKEWPAHWPGRISIGAARIGGGFYQTGSALANAIGKVWPKADVVVEQTKASVHNIKLIEAGEIAVGLCTTNTAWDGWYGLGVFEKEHREMRLLVPTQACGFLFCTAKKDNINCPTDFKKGMKVSGLMKGSAADVILHNIFETLGVEAEIINMSTTDSAQAFKSGLIQGYVLGHPNPSMQEVSLSMDTNIFGVSGELAEKFGSYWLLLSLYSKARLTGRFCLCPC